MKMAEGGGRRRQPPRKLTMEHYLDFIHSNKQLDLTVPQLNQIIDMHGFKKMHRALKTDTMEAVKTMELMDPSRSTLGDAGVSSDAFISLDDLIKDINELQWKECRITSMQTINTVDYDDLQHQISSSSESTLTVASSSSAKSTIPRKKPKKLAGNGGDISSTTSFDFGGSPSGPLVMKLVPRKRKKNVNYINCNPIGNNNGDDDGDLVGSAESVIDLQPLDWSDSQIL